MKNYLLFVTTQPLKAIQDTLSHMMKLESTSCPQNVIKMLVITRAALRGIMG